MFAKERLYLTADKKGLVREGDRRAAFLYATPGDEIPETAAKAFGLVDGKLPEKGKASVPPVNPAKQSDANSGDDLTVIKGIGKKTAVLLTGAGIETFAALAAIDPKTPVVMIPGVSEAEWDAWATAAKELTAGND